MTEYFDILLPALALTAFVGNAIHVMYFMDHSPAASERTTDDGQGDSIETQPHEQLTAAATLELLAEVTPVPGVHLPEDSVLRRHYLTHLCCQLNELYQRPRESVLRRHHGQLIASQIEECVLEHSAVVKLQAAHEILKKQNLKEVSNPVAVGIAPSPHREMLDVSSETVAQIPSFSKLKVQEAEPESEMPPMGSHVPEDHVLRRHYLTHILGMLNDLYPAPTDSVLRRHHLQHFKNLLARCLGHEAAVEQLTLDWVAARKKSGETPNWPEPAKAWPIVERLEKGAVPEATDATTVFGPHVPQDHVLRRHYVSLLEGRLNEVTPPPTDSVLRRHHQQRIAAQLAHCTEDARVAAAFHADYEQWISERGKTSITIAPKPMMQELARSNRPFNLPEDSVLRRHSIQRLSAEIEKLKPRPTDSVLSRHYDQWLASEMEVLL
jgi:hypothetical protein